MNLKKLIFVILSFFVIGLCFSSCTTPTSQEVCIDYNISGDVKNNETDIQKQNDYIINIDDIKCYLGSNYQNGIDNHIKYLTLLEWTQELGVYEDAVIKTEYAIDSEKKSYQNYDNYLSENYLTYDDRFKIILTSKMQDVIINKFSKDIVVDSIEVENYKKDNDLRKIYKFKYYTSIYENELKDIYTLFENSKNDLIFSKYIFNEDYQIKFDDGFYNQLWNLKSGQYSDILKINDNYYIYYLEEIVDLEDDISILNKIKIDKASEKFLNDLFVRIAEMEKRVDINI